MPGMNRRPGDPEYTGEFIDGLGNKITMLAVANPHPLHREGPFSFLYDQACGYGIVKFNKAAGTYTIESWPLYADPNNPASGGQYPGWPRTISMLDNYGRKAAAYLPTIEVTGLKNPVLQVFDEADGSLVYALRIRGDAFRPKVFKPDGSYTLKIGEPSAKKLQVFMHVKPAAKADDKLEAGF